MTTRVISKREAKRTPDEVYIGRGSKWGNPFSHLANSKAGMRVGSRDEAIERYEIWLTQQPHLMEALGELKGKTLVCYCKPLACHGDILARLTDRT